MLVAFSGAQGSGKTTVLNKLASLGFNVIERKTARSVLAEWNTTLDAVYRDPPRNVEFQELCLNRKAADEQAAIESDQLWFTERSYADVFTYPALTISPYNEYSDWINDYFNRCLDLQMKYLAVFNFEGGAFKTENDGVRGFNQHYVDLVNRTLTLTLTKMVHMNSITFGSTPPIYTIQKHLIDINERTRTVVQTSQQLWLATCLPTQPIVLNTKSSFLTEENI